jgi:hypothetical protein
VDLKVPEVLRNACRSAHGLPVGLAAMERMLGRLSKRCVLASTIRVQGKKRMGTIYRLCPVLAVTEPRARARRSQTRRFTVPRQLLDGYRRLAKIISREIAGNRRGTGGLTGWLVSPWR